MADTVMYSVATDEHPQLDANPPLTAAELQVNTPHPTLMGRLCATSRDRDGALHARACAACCGWSTAPVRSRNVTRRLGARLQALWSNGLGTSTRVHREGWQHWVYLEDLVYEGTLGEDWAAPSKTQSEELWEAVLPADSLLVVILDKLDSPLSLERRAAARLLLINFRDQKHKEVRLGAWFCRSIILYYLSSAGARPAWGGGWMRNGGVHVARGWAGLLAQAVRPHRHALWSVRETAIRCVGCR
jgi:hypothetical protein